VVNRVKANRIYEIDEAGAEPESSKLQAPGFTGVSTLNAQPIFEDVSQLLQHRHHEEEYDDFARQPLLPKKLSQSGPGVSWFDVDGDGWEDLIIGSGQGGRLAVYLNDGKGGFQKFEKPPFNETVTRDQTSVLGWVHEGRRIILAGSANYEDGLSAGPSARQYDLKARRTDDTLPGQESSTGPLALADYDGDGDLDLFVGGRVIPGLYPAAASSRIFRNDQGKLVLDADNTKALQGVGLVSGAVFSDLDGDGKPELVLACEWGPIRIFRNERGKLVPWDPQVEVNAQRSTLNQLTGWWTGVTTGDLDGDGKLDIVAGNWGRNSKYESQRNKPLKLYYGDLAGDGSADIVEAHYDVTMQKEVPDRGLEIMGKAMPFLREKFTSHRAYAAAAVVELLGDRIKMAKTVEANWLESTVFLNRGDHFEVMAMPAEAQFAPVFAVCIGDCDGDGHEDVFLSQNFFGTNPETARNDGGRGLWLKGDGKGNLAPMPGQQSGVRVYGEQRGAALCDYDADGRVDLVVTQNGAETKLYHNTGARPGLRVRLKGTAGNPTGVGSMLRFKNKDRVGPMREIHAGSGYWSQNSAVQVLGSPTPPEQIEVQWPGGKTTTHTVPLQAKEIVLERD
jgi:hypothetical protein